MRLHRCLGLPEPSLIDCFYLTISTKISGAGSYGHRCEKTCLQGFANNKGADQPAHLRSTFVIRSMKGIISRLAAREITIF